MSAMGQKQTLKRRSVVSRFNPQRRHSVTTSSLAAADSPPSGCIQANQEMADFGGLRQFNQLNDLRKGRTTIFVLARGSHRAVSLSQDWRAVTASCLKSAPLVGYELMVSAWPEPPSAMSAEKSAGVRDGMQAFAFGTSETPPNGAGEESGVQNFPGTIAASETLTGRCPLRVISGHW